MAGAHSQQPRYSRNGGSSSGGKTGVGNSGAVRGGGETHERIYSARQLVEALGSATAHVRDQLQVLSILDGTAMSWPGVSQAVEDLEFLVALSAKSTTGMEADVQRLGLQLQEANSEVETLRETVALANKHQEEAQRELNRSREDNKREVDGLHRDAKALSGRLEAAERELQREKQSGWELERQRADLAAELDKYKQDNEFMEGEITTLRAGYAEQNATITTLKEELSGRRADVNHLTKQVAEHRINGETLRKALEAAQINARELQSSLQVTRSERDHYEKEFERQQDECGRLSAELEKTAKELARLKDWGDVVKKVEADKLREANDALAKTKMDQERQRSELSHQLSSKVAELGNHTERLKGKEAELAAHAKQVALLQAQIRDLQRHVAQSDADKNAAMRSVAEAKAAAAALAKEVTDIRLQMSGAEREQFVAAAAAKEALQREVDVAKAAATEAARETALQKALAEGWQRDFKSLTAKLKAEADRCRAVQVQLDMVHRERAEGQVATVKHDVLADQRIRELSAQVEAKEADLKKAKYDAASTLKQLQTQVTRLQRENDASAEEIQKLRGQAGNVEARPGLPGLAAKRESMHDDLAILKRLLNAQPLGAQSSASLPVLSRTALAPAMAPTSNVVKAAAAKRNQTS